MANEQPCDRRYPWNKKEYIMNYSILVLIGIMFFSTKSTVFAATFQEDCRALSKAIYAVAEARDNSNDQSWEQLLKIHPILKIQEKSGGAGIDFAKAISRRIINKNKSPDELMLSTYEGCVSNPPCALYGEGCGQ